MFSGWKWLIAKILENSTQGPRPSAIFLASISQTCIAESEIQTCEGEQKFANFYFRSILLNTFDGIFLVNLRNPFFLALAKAIEKIVQPVMIVTIFTECTSLTYKLYYIC